MYLWLVAISFMNGAKDGVAPAGGGEGSFLSRIWQFPERHAHIVAGTM